MNCVQFGIDMDLDLFLRWLFTDSTMVNHHFSTTIWENMFGTFSKHLFQANPNKWFSKSQKVWFLSLGSWTQQVSYTSKGLWHTNTNMEPKNGGLGPCFSILPSGKFFGFQLSAVQRQLRKQHPPRPRPRWSQTTKKAFRRNADRCGSSVRWLGANNLEEWLVMGVTTHV